MIQPDQEFADRRTFAIISHPDAGKTTITEKLLLFGNAIQVAGTVKGRKSDRHATSDWMAMEKERGISVTSSGSCWIASRRPSRSRRCSTAATTMRMVPTLHRNGYATRA